MQTISTILFWIPLFYIIIINIIAFLTMWWDKRKASQDGWRIAEVTLHILGIVGGAVGILAGMYRMRHKTQKRSFQAVTIIGLVLSLLIYWLVGNYYF